MLAFEAHLATGSTCTFVNRLQITHTLHAFKLVQFQLDILGDWPIEIAQIKCNDGGELKSYFHAGKTLHKNSFWALGGSHEILQELPRVHVRASTGIATLLEETLRRLPLQLRAMGEWNSCIREECFRFPVCISYLFSVNNKITWLQ